MTVTITFEPGGEGPGLAVLTLDRPPVNAFDDATKNDLLAAVAELSRREDLGAVIVHGASAFGAGDDIKEMAGHGRTHAIRGRERISEVCLALEAIPVPVIAAVTRFALGGGCELALAADFRITAADAQWGLPEILLGLIPAAGGTQRLPLLVGPARAKRMIFTGRTISGTEAVSWGLADEAVPADRVLDTARRWAEEMVSQAPLALRAAKLAVREGLSHGLDAGLRLESALFAGLFATEDAAKGLASFVAEGPGRARFSGR